MSTSVGSNIPVHESLATLFYRGEYGLILANTVDRGDGTQSSVSWKDYEFIVGALSFAGRNEEGELLLERYRSEMAEPTVIACRFYLGVTWCRKLAFRQARAHFAANARCIRRLENDFRSRFFIFQGLAFYRYTYGYLKHALRYAELAYKAAFSADFLYGRVLAQEIKGHSQVGTGAVRQGLAALRSAAEWAQRLGRGMIAHAIESGIEYYQATFGITKDPLDSLRQMLAKLSPEDTYARTFLQLEIAHQMQMRGQLRASRAILDEACQQAYQFNNVRLEAHLNFRLAYQHVISGEYSQALNLLKNTKARLRPDVDKLLEMRVLGLEVAVRKRLGFESHHDEALLLRLTERTGQNVGRRILERSNAKVLRTTTGEGQEGLEQSSMMMAGQDPLGDLMDRMASGGAGSVAEILESGYLSLLHAGAQLDSRNQYLVFGLEGQSLTIFDRGEIQHLPEGISNLQRKLVVALAEQECSKEDLCRTLWGQNYHPLRHDPLIYALVSKLRRVLGERSKWLEVAETGYRLDLRVKVRSMEKLRYEGKSSAVEALGEDLGLNPGWGPGLDPEKAALVPSGDFESSSASSLARVGGGKGNASNPAASGLAPISSARRAALEKWQSMLNFRQLELLRTMGAGELLDVAQHSRLFSVSAVTAGRDLAQLEKLGFCRRIGKGRATKYEVAKESDPILAT